MPYDEYLKWQQYFEERPVDWRDDLRFMRILQALGIKAKPEAIFESLAKKKSASDERYESQEKSTKLLASLKNSVLFSKLLGASGGDSPDFLKKE